MDEVTRDRARTLLERLRGASAPPGGRFRVMNVCGGHERSISQAGLRRVFPPWMEVIPGPGCPVCVCPEEDIRLAIELALQRDVTLVTFGDMLRVPVSGASAGSLEQARAAGGDIVAVASPTEAWAVAEAASGKETIFFAAGFETTMGPVAARVAQGLPNNMRLLVSGRLTWPAVAMLLESEEPGFDALIAPGHVATVMGPEQWRFVPENHGLPTAISGFAPEDILLSVHAVFSQFVGGKAELQNCYARVVRPEGNPRAQEILDEVFEVRDANWRGVGVIPDSGFQLRPRWAAHDAKVAHGELSDTCEAAGGRMPKGCACASVVLGRIYPNQCALYGSLCTPREPVGPCMVSDEGACRIWWSAGERQHKAGRGSHDRC